MTSAVILEEHTPQRRNELQVTVKGHQKWFNQLGYFFFILVEVRYSYKVPRFPATTCCITKDFRPSLGAMYFALRKEVPPLY